MIELVQLAADELTRTYQARQVARAATSAFCRGIAPNLISIDDHEALGRAEDDYLAALRCLIPPGTEIGVSAASLYESPVACSPLKYIAAGELTINEVDHHANPQNNRYRSPFARTGPNAAGLWLDRLFGYRVKVAPDRYLFIGRGPTLQLAVTEICK